MKPTKLTIAEIRDYDRRIIIQAPDPISLFTQSIPLTMPESQYFGPRWQRLKKNRTPGNTQYTPKKKKRK